MKKYPNKAKITPFKEGERLYVTIPEEHKKWIVIAVKAKKDTYFCYDCCFWSRCREYKGYSPFGYRCITTVFKVEKEYE